VKANALQTVKELASELQITHSTVHGHLQDFGYMSQLGKWILHALTLQKKQEQVDTVGSLLTCHRRAISGQNADKG